MEEWRTVARRTFVTVGIFSTFVNLLMLTMPIYLFQISDRVLTSRSIDTLLMLSTVALGFIVVLSLARYRFAARCWDGWRPNWRRYSAARCWPVLSQRRRSATAATCNRCAACTRCASFISSPVMLLLFDAPLAPIYFAAVFLIHRDLGFIVSRCGTCC